MKKGHRKIKDEKLARENSGNFFFRCVAFERRGKINDADCHGAILTFLGGVRVLPA